MSRATMRAIDDIREVVEEDDRAALLAELRRRGLFDEAESWLEVA